MISRQLIRDSRGPWVTPITARISAVAVLSIHHVAFDTMMNTPEFVEYCILISLEVLIKFLWKSIVEKNYLYDCRLIYS